MSSGKKGKKTKGKPVPLGEFLGAASPGGGSAVVVNKTSWAEESEDYDDRYVAPERFALPTAPRTARGPDVDPERIPTSPPFTAYIANLPFEVDDMEIERFFMDLKIKSIRLPREGGENGRFKGFGYVEFDTRSDLIDALSKNDDLMRNRKIRIDVAEGGEGGQRRGFSDRGPRDEDRMERSEGVSDWRAGPRDAPSRDGGRDDRSPGRGGFDRDRRDDRGYGDRDRGGFGDRDRGGYGDRDRGFGDRDRDRDRYGDRDRGGGFGDRDRGDRYGGGGGRYDDDRRGFRDGGDSQWRRDDGPRGPPRDDAGPRTRPKLNLKPRSAPASEEKGDAPSANSSIFGSARPVDTASRERQIEDKLHSKDAPAPPKKESAGGTTNIFGSAKPVDTAAREREIEEKIRRDEPRRDDRRDDRRDEPRRDDRRDDRRDEPRRDDRRDEPRRDDRRDDRKDDRRDDRKIERRDDRRDDRKIERRDDREDDRRDNRQDDRSAKRDNNVDRRDDRGSRDVKEGQDEPKKNNEVNMKGKHAEDNEVILSVTNKFASLEMEMED